MTDEELVVLCAEDGSAIGTAPKSTVHGAATPLHLAFSAYVFDPGGRFLVTRRARHKLTFAGVRTNSCCGHPAPGENGADAVARRLESELGIVPSDITLVLPAFRYQARDLTGVVENELCPVYRVIARDSAVRADPDEVDSAWWMPWAAFASDPVLEGDPLSRWAALQLPQLAALGPDPLLWPEADAGLLPLAMPAA
ncbi:MAG: hypothetical protein JWN61_1141 [Pseudonocardiales bacterium]|nr:hypothetical protein [Pseudonocardiales bacterium]